MDPGLGLRPNRDDNVQRDERIPRFIGAGLSSLTSSPMGVAAGVVRHVALELLLVLLQLR